MIKRFYRFFQRICSEREINSTPTPPYFLWKMKKANSVSNRDYEALKRIFLQEAKSNSMTTTSPPLKILWRPNNYRRQIKVKPKDNSTIQKIRSAIDSTNMGQHGFRGAIDSTIKGQNITINEHTKMISVKDWQGCTIQYGKNTLTGIYTQFKIDGIKRTLQIEADSIEQIDKRLDKHKKLIKGAIDTALKSFIKTFNLKIDNSNPTWSRYEDWIKGDDYLDNIPEGTIIHDTVGKKVYKEGFEFTQTKNKEPPIVNMKNYIKERALEKFTPEIAKKLKDIKQSIELLNPLNYLMQRIKAVEDVFNYKDIIKSLSVTDKREFEAWLFTIQ